MKLASFLVDTDWVIDHFNGVGSITQRLQELHPQGLALSIISIAELWEGVHFSKDPTRSEAMLAEFVSGVVILGIDDEICRRFGQLRGSLRGAGKIVGDFDLLIAASALRHNLTLLTNNRPILKESRACTWRVRPRKVRLPPILAEARTHAAVREESQ